MDALPRGTLVHCKTSRSADLSCGCPPALCLSCSVSRCWPLGSESPSVASLIRASQTWNDLQRRRAEFSLNRRSSAAPEDTMRRSILVLGVALMALSLISCDQLQQRG